MNINLITFFILAVMQGCAATLAAVLMIPDDMGVAFYFWGFIGLTWLYISVLLSIDLLKKDHLVLGAIVKAVKGGRVTVTLESGKEARYFVMDQDLASKLVPRHHVEVVVLRRMKRVIDVRT
ncbi:hypothetical protein [Paenibacillus sp. Soil522]|uniref:hypothetical protein n=1 Tax=Paenibacillus sp. Soil522 TaxID=1736388 RepID=UPI0006FFB716|nr:hypothetical protein [Paenibacillus sp. Soil522]KRE35666.1 hypothetical protein ASG81_20735 [Paenibacillus sp. Soil522]